jgi:UDP-N-acetylmuramyl pentapeptide phosphotransferase/UDP-N-acetylglucosamine-1-phosphate transferase
MAAIPKIIYVAKKKQLFDKPDNNRKIHLNVTPNLGGVGIFFSFITVTSLFISAPLIDKWSYIIASCVVLFLIGINDDLVTVSPYKKFMAQFVAAFITVCLADIRINSLHGIFGIYQMPYWYSVIFTIIGSMFITNAYNLVDGIDGLAGSLGIMATFLLGVSLGWLGNIGGACIAFSITGATLGFLRYNVSPAKIFMGDTGSLLIGFVISILAIVFVHSYNVYNPIVAIIHSHKGSMIVALAILFVPVFDSFRVFIRRATRGISPFRADRSHLHHYLLDAGFSHSQSVAILLISNTLIIIVALLVQDYEPNVGLGCILLVAGALFTILYILRKNKLAKNKALIEERKKKTQFTGSSSTPINPDSVAVNG